MSPVAMANSQTMPGEMSCWAWDWLTGAPSICRSQFYRRSQIAAERGSFCLPASFGQRQPLPHFGRDFIGAQALRVVEDLRGDHQLVGAGAGDEFLQLLAHRV